MVGSKAESGKSLWSTKGNMTVCEDADDYGNDVIERDDILASWRRKSNESSPVLSSRDEKQVNVQRSAHSTASTYSNYELAERELQKRDTEENLNDPREDEEAGAIDDEEAAAVQEQVRQIRAQEDEFETFILKIVHRKTEGREKRPCHLIRFHTNEINFPYTLESDNTKIAEPWYNTEYDDQWQEKANERARTFSTSSVRPNIEPWLRGGERHRLGRMTSAIWEYYGLRASQLARLVSVTGQTRTDWRRKSNESSPVLSSRDEKQVNVQRSAHSTASTYSNYELAERELQKRDTEENLNDPREDEEAGAIDDEEAAAVQEQVRQIRAQEDEFETFILKIVHRKNRTGFEEDKNFHVVLNSVIAGRYHVTEYLGSAAFSKAIQAHDLHTGMDVCMKIIKNNKDFFDQSLDEIKLLKYVNKHDPGDKYHILRLYDYFYYREHLFIVCELLKANLYEFHKFNRESGGEVYFTMPRLQSITIQCLEALQFLHNLGLIHCDLKPENILVKSYSRCEVKVIDLGSSCFQTDHLCSYVQSRSYRAPEVILGLPYDKKIDIWSLGCILAELCSGNVLFQNDSPATLLARVVGIIGPIDQDMLVKGRDTYKYFTKNHMLYERSQDTNRLEYLIPKKTSLRHRLPMGDQGFIDFVEYLLEINPNKRPTASEALKHPWLSYPYEPISS
ncbi:hypothetical protein KI387_025109 [Taxus chinensis]|uniref:Protein kinase domain-containing protein n=1 Tax=Taxus chinensis TaxID=29808 RepID=A0AA38G5K4_TAXCH|nr:hypothetical protein KI387_025109 [Taxus chinensis]